MKNYSRKHNFGGRRNTAYRTPSRFRAQKAIVTKNIKAQIRHVARSRGLMQGDGKK